MGTRYRIDRELKKVLEGKPVPWRDPISIVWERVLHRKKRKAKKRAK
jgi:hypothetical protein